MKMPSGYNALDVLRIKCPGKEDMNRLREAQRLLKVMAEALEKGLKYEDCPKIKPCHIYGHAEMADALKQFKEFK